VSPSRLVAAARVEAHAFHGAAIGEAPLCIGLLHHTSQIQRFTLPEQSLFRLLPRTHCR
jgi:hypothetical protein